MDPWDKTNRPLIAPGIWWPACVVTICLILVLGLVVLCRLAGGPVWE